MKILAVVVLLSISSVFGYAQDWADTEYYGFRSDSLAVTLRRVDTNERANDTYEVQIKNFRVDPICIMHSAHYFLNTDFPPVRLALYKTTDSFDIFNLGWVLEDLEVDDHYSPDYYNAEPVLPYQTLTFRIVLPEYLRPRRIIFDYIVLPDLHYKKFKRAIYKNSGMWYKGKVRRPIVLNLYPRKLSRLMMGIGPAPAHAENK